MSSVGIRFRNENLYGSYKSDIIVYIYIMSRKSVMRWFVEFIRNESTLKTATFSSHSKRHHFLLNTPRYKVHFHLLLIAVYSTGMYLIDS